MKRKYIGRCRQLRKNQTDAEKKLWMLLRGRQIEGVKFRRQFPIDKYIIDFYAPEYKLGIEADGGQHYYGKTKQKDKIREIELSRLGVKILRFSDTDILKNIEGVWEVIQTELLKKKPPSPFPSPRWVEGKRGESRKE
ncbi:MAG TPA: endonuclease domain-containing protein [Candidatus Ratteibacteria bacterium]|nr:endonuclease domain-containing protein [bacterium]HRR95879.1 endonuclease domain-containing protein [Candidatus Ratteibacteria bacterium]